MNDRRCYTPKEYAAKRKVSVRTIQRLILAGKIPAERVGKQWRIWVRTGDSVASSATVATAPTHLQ